MRKRLEGVEKKVAGYEQSTKLGIEEKRQVRTVGQSVLYRCSKDGTVFSSVLLRVRRPVSEWCHWRPWFQLHPQVSTTAIQFAGYLLTSSALCGRRGGG